MKSKLKFSQLKDLIKEARQSEAARVTGDFIDSVDEQLNSRGSLSAKQEQALRNIIANVRKDAHRMPSDYYIEFHELEDEYYNDDFDPFDP